MNTRSPRRRVVPGQSSRIIRLVMAAALATPCIGACSSAGETGQTPRVFANIQNYPDRLPGAARIEYDLDSAGPVSLKVYNLLGQEVAILVNRRQEAGRYIIPYTAFTLSSGVYFYRLESGSDVSTHRLVLIH